MQILIIGCGSLGQELGERLLRESEVERVTGTTRREDRLDELRRVGIEPQFLDLADREAVRHAVRDAGNIVFCAAPGRSRDEGRDPYREVYGTGLGHVLEAIPETGASDRWLAVTVSTAVYGQTDGSWVDESSETSPSSERGQILVEAERRVREAAARRGFHAILARLAGLHAPGRGPQNVADRQAGRTRDDGESWLNLVHQSDAVEALARLLLGRHEGTFNIADGQPLTRRDFYDPLLRARGLEPIDWQHPRGGPGDRGRRVSNELVERVTSVDFRVFDPKSSL